MKYMTEIHENVRITIDADLSYPGDTAYTMFFKNSNKSFVISVPLTRAKLIELVKSVNQILAET